MQLSQNNYNSLCKLIGVKPNYLNGYFHCNNIYNNNYLNSIVMPNLKGEKDIIFLFLESCPSKTNDYIFDKLSNQMNSKTDKYLWNICVGFGINPKHKTKRDCLIELTQYKNKDDQKIPVVIIDLFPFHGINLKNKRKAICENIAIRNMLIDTNFYITIIIKKLFNPQIYFLFGVPYTIWNFTGGYGSGSLYCGSTTLKSGLLGIFDNKNVIVNVGGQTISSKAIKNWIKKGM